MKKKILILAPHTDDGEFGMGGTISRLIEEGHEVRYVAFSDCQESIPDGFPKNALALEMYEATKSLGISRENVILLPYKVRKLNFSRQEILEDMIRVKKDFRPDIVFTPSTNDVHQDHQTVTREAIRAYKTSTIYGYELPWNNFTLPSTCLIKLEERHVLNKEKALALYKSQGFRPYSSLEYIKALAMTRGVRIGVSYAEAFEVIRLVL